MSSVEVQIPHLVFPWWDLHFLGERGVGRVCWEWAIETQGRHKLCFQSQARIPASLVTSHDLNAPAHFVQCKIIRHGLSEGRFQQKEKITIAVRKLANEREFAAGSFWGTGKLGWLTEIQYRVYRLARVIPITENKKSEQTLESRNSSEVQTKILLFFLPWKNCLWMKMKRTLTPEFKET